MVRSSTAKRLHFDGLHTQLDEILAAGWRDPGKFLSGSFVTYGIVIMGMRDGWYCFH